MSDKCEHKFVYMESILRKYPVADGFEYNRIDLFFCEKCLHQEQKERRQVKGFNQLEPDWYIIENNLVQSSTNIKK